MAESDGNGSIEILGKILDALRAQGVTLQTHSNFLQDISSRMSMIAVDVEVERQARLKIEQRLNEIHRRCEQHAEVLSALVTNGSHRERPESPDNGTEVASVFDDEEDSEVVGSDDQEDEE